ncbi:MAG: dienelactone hydrolase family protein [Pseudomonadota bacterium]
MHAVHFLALALLTSPLVLSHQSADAQELCGGPDQPCAVPLGTYFAALPDEQTEAKRPVVLFFHGGGGWGSRIFKLRQTMTADFNRRGYVVIAPNGKKRPGSRFGPGWAFIPQFPPHRDDLAFTREILDDAEARFGIDKSRVLMTGYSIGGSIVSYLACRDPGIAKAYAPVAGGFWRPHPEDCAGPVRLLHTHGWRDQTVPLEGRPVSTVGVEQGDIYETLRQWRTENACEKYRADTFVTEGPFWRRIWTHCAPGTALEFALHAGGHEVPSAWPALAMDWFEGLADKSEETD